MIKIKIKKYLKYLKKAIRSNAKRVMVRKHCLIVKDQESQSFIQKMRCYHLTTLSRVFGFSNLNPTRSK
jgi:hypothetical protein